METVDSSPVSSCLLNTEVISTDSMGIMGKRELPVECFRLARSWAQLLPYAPASSASGQADQARSTKAVIVDLLHMLDTAAALSI